MLFFIFFLICFLASILGAICGIGGGRRLSEKTVDRLFLLLMLVIIGINIYNIYRFTY